MARGINGNGPLVHPGGGCVSIYFGILVLDSSAWATGWDIVREWMSYQGSRLSCSVGGLYSRQANNLLQSTQLSSAQPSFAAHVSSPFSPIPSRAQQLSVASQKNQIIIRNMDFVLGKIHGEWQHCPICGLCPTFKCDDWHLFQILIWPLFFLKVSFFSDVLRINLHCISLVLWRNTAFRQNVWQCYPLKMTLILTKHVLQIDFQVQMDVETKNKKAPHISHTHLKSCERGK